MRTRTASAAVAEFAPFGPAAIAFAMFVVWVTASGGYFPGQWYPSAMVAVALFVATVLVRGRLLPEPPAAKVAVAAFAALVAFNYLSIAWAGSRGTALDASNELLLYLALAWSLSLLPWTPRSLAVAMCLWSAAIAILCLLGLIRAIGSASLDPFFIEFRYATPLNYPNATAALAVMGMWPALLLSANREVPGWARSGLLAVAVFLAEFSLLPQSRAAVVGLALTAPLALAFAGNRLALLARAAIVGGGLALTVGPTVHVDNTISAGGQVGPALHHAAAVIFATSAVSLLLGGLLVTAEPWLVRLRGPDRPPTRRLGRRGWAVAAVIGAVALGLASPELVHLARTVYQKGRTDAGTTSSGSTRLLSVSPEERFDYVRVAWKLFESAPLAGVGAGNFGPRYDALRRFPRHSKYPHDVALRALSETGLIGFLLFAVTVVALAVGAVRRSLTTAGLSRACLVAALVVAAYFLVHDSLDWLDEFPALAVPALAFPLAALGIAHPGRRSRGATHRVGPAALAELRSRTGARVAACGALVLVAVALVLVVLGAPYLSQQYVTTALRTYKAQPSVAYADLSRATELNPWSAQPLLTEGEIAERLGDPARARVAFERVLGIEDNWYAWIELALLDAHAGRFHRAGSELGKAAKLDVDDPVIAEARTMIQRHQRIRPVRFNALFTQGINAVLFSPEHIK